MLGRCCTTVRHLQKPPSVLRRSCTADTKSQAGALGWKDGSVTARSRPAPVWHPTAAGLKPGVRSPAFKPGAWEVEVGRAECETSLVSPKSAKGHREILSLKKRKKSVKCLSKCWRKAFYDEIIRCPLSLRIYIYINISKQETFCICP